MKFAGRRETQWLKPWNRLPWEKETKKYFLHIIYLPYCFSGWNPMKQSHQLSFILWWPRRWPGSPVHKSPQFAPSWELFRDIPMTSRKALFLYHLWWMQFKKLATYMLSSFASEMHRKSLGNFHIGGVGPPFLYYKTGFLYKMGCLAKMRECVFYKIHGVHVNKNIFHYNMDAASVRKSCFKEAGCIHFVENSPLQNERPSVW